MSLWGLPINTTTMINIVVSVGFSVDNSAHFCHGYMIAPIKTYENSNEESALNEKHERRTTFEISDNSYLNNIKFTNNPKKLERHKRILFALNAVGVPILAGDISTICALVPLSSSESEIFVSFFKTLLLVMLFGIIHSLLFLPIVFSMIGPTNVRTAKIISHFSDINSNSKDNKNSKNNHKNKDKNQSNGTEDHVYHDPTSHELPPTIQTGKLAVAQQSSDVHDLHEDDAAHYQKSLSVDAIVEE